jgi:hypothetical protein
MVRLKQPHLRRAGRWSQTIIVSMTICNLPLQPDFGLETRPSFTLKKGNLLITGTLSDAPNQVGQMTSTNLLF